MTSPHFNNLDGVLFIKPYQKNQFEVRYHLKERTELKGLTMKAILSHPENKHSLTEIFSNFFIELMGHIFFVLAHGFVLKCYVLGWDQDQHSHFEADTLLICMLNEALRLRHEASSVLNGCYFLIISPDTDVIVLAINFVQQIDEGVKVEFQLITSGCSRTISVNRWIKTFQNTFWRLYHDKMLPYWCIQRSDKVKVLQRIS